MKFLNLGKQLLISVATFLVSSITLYTLFSLGTMLGNYIACH